MIALRAGWEPCLLMGNNSASIGTKRDIFTVFAVYDGWKLAIDDHGNNSDMMCDFIFDSEDAACEVAELILSKWAK